MNSKQARELGMIKGILAHWPTDEEHRRNRRKERLYFWLSVVGLVIGPLIVEAIR